MKRLQRNRASFRQGTLGAFVTLEILSLTGIAFAAPQTPMAPPVNYSAVPHIGYATTPSVAPAPPAYEPEASGVFSWTEIPQNTPVELTRAVFDQGGYQLFDTVGETIIVPFANQNLYVMKFAQSTNGTMYFVNDGGTPILYLPQNGYLENATVPGSRWFPFSEQFHPVQPVFMGIAPSYTEYVSSRWYPDTVLYGGYYGPSSYISGGIFGPSLGLTFVIGGQRYRGWSGYREYAVVHPAPYPIRYYRPHIYVHENHSIEAGHVFAGAGHSPRDHEPYNAHSVYKSGGFTLGESNHQQNTYHSDSGHIFHGGYSDSHEGNNGNPKDTFHPHGGNNDAPNQHFRGGSNGSLNYGTPPNYGTSPNYGMGTHTGNGSSHERSHGNGRRH